VNAQFLKGRFSVLMQLALVLIHTAASVRCSHPKVARNRLNGFLVWSRWKSSGQRALFVSWNFVEPDDCRRGDEVQFGLGDCELAAIATRVTLARFGAPTPKEAVARSRFQSFLESLE